MNNEASFWDRGYSLSALGTTVGLPGTPSRLAATALALLACAALVTARRRELVDDREALALAIGIAIVFSPVSWLHYSALLLVAAALLSPRLSAAWVLPLGFWISPFEEADGTVWRILFVLALDVLTARRADPGLPRRRPRRLEQRRRERLCASSSDAVGRRAGPARDDLLELGSDVVEPDAVVGGDALGKARRHELAVARPARRLAVVVRARAAGQEAEAVGAGPRAAARTNR